MTLYRRSSLGDVVLVGKAVASAEARVDVCTAPEWVPLVQRFHGVHLAHSDRHLADPSWVDLQGDLPVANRRIHKHSVRRRLRLLTASVGPRPAVSALYRQAAQLPLISVRPWVRFTAQPRTHVAFIIGSRHKKKALTVALAVELAQQLDEPSIFVSGPESRKDLEDTGFPYVASQGFDDVINTFTRCRVAVGGDTGLMHLAAGCGARLVTLLGPTHPADGFIEHKGAVVQRHDLWCRPCSLTGGSWCRRREIYCRRWPVVQILRHIQRQVQCDGW